MKRFALLALLLVVSGLLAAACSAGTPSVQQVVVTKEIPSTVQVEVTRQVQVQVTPTVAFKKVLHEGTFGVGDVPTIDPALSTDTTSTEIVEETTVGLTRQDETTAAIGPGLATKWDMSQDGKTYTFTLMTGIPWVRYNASTGQVEKVKDADGKERTVKCSDFEYGIKRTLDPKTASDYAYVLNSVIVGAEEYNTADTTKLKEEDLKKLQDAVGVKCTDDTTLVINIKEPASFFPNIAGLWVAHAQPEWLIADKGDRWTEPGFFQGYGPYTLKAWNHESDMTLIANPFWPGTDNIPKPKIEEINFPFLDESPQFANYETGKADFSVVPLSELDRVKADPQLSKELNVSPNLCTYYYGFNVTKAPFDDPNVRKAFSWAIDRTAIVDNVTKGGQEPARWFARPGVTAAPDPKKGDDFGPPVKADPAKAKEFLAASKYKTVDQLPPVTLMVNQVEGHVKIAEAVQQMWKENLGVDVKLTTQEWKVYLKTLQDDPPQIFRLGWCQDYPDANNFDKEVFHKGSTQNNTRWNNPDFDKLTDQAAVETDVAKRHDLYVQAEKILIEQDAAIAPIYWYTNVRICKPYVKCIPSVLGDKYHFEKWDIQPH